ncbi:hypothetical protein ACFE04_004361 [Oxalis oulophora]
MEFQFSYMTILIAFVFTFVIYKRFKAINSTSKLPPGPKKLPFIGNLHLLFGKLPHHCLSDLAKIYGPIMHLQLGEISTVVVSSPEIAKEIFHYHDSNFSERPYLYSMKSITYDYSDIAFARYDNQWRQLRNICNSELLSQKRIQSFRSIRDEEYSRLVRSITSTRNSPTNIGKMLFSLSLDILTRTLLGKEFKHQEAFIYNIKEIITLMAGFSAVDVFPSIKVFHLINAVRPKFKKLHREVDEILECIIREHRANMVHVDKAEDLLSVLLDIQNKSNDLNKVSLTNNIIKAVILDLYLAGSEASSTSAEWAMSELMREPRVMEKAKAEVRQVFDSEGKVEESKLNQLKYINCVIKETYRVHPLTPLLVPRESREKCEINGYEIPEKTRLLINTWAISHDAKHWTEPEIFYPERFLERQVKFGEVDYELMPFGVGRRRCPGEAYGHQAIALMLANLLFHFDWKLPNGQNPQDLDMTEVFRTTSQRKNNLVLIPFLRKESTQRTTE